MFKHCLYSLGCFDQQFADEVHRQLRHPGEGLPAVVHVHLGHVQVRLLLVVTGKRRLTRHQHVGNDPNAPEEHRTRTNTTAITQTKLTCFQVLDKTSVQEYPCVLRPPFKHVKNIHRLCRLWTKNNFKNCSKNGLIAKSKLWIIVNQRRDSPQVSCCCDWLIIKDLWSLTENKKKRKSTVIQHSKNVLCNCWHDFNHALSLTFNHAPVLHIRYVCLTACAFPGPFLESSFYQTPISNWAWQSYTITHQLFLRSEILLQNELKQILI